MLETGFTFKRKNFVKDLLNPDACLKGTSIMEFESFEAFKKTVAIDKKINIGSAEKSIVPVASAAEVDFLMQINAQNRPFIIIKLNDFSFDTLNAFRRIQNTSLLIDDYNIPKLKSALVEKPCKNFADFCMNTFGYFRVNVSANDVNEWIWKLTAPFFEFPFFCIADVNIDYVSFNDKPIITMDAIEWQCNIMSYNMSQKKRGMNWELFGGVCENNCQDCDGGCLERFYKFDTIHYNRAKRVFISDEGKMYIETKEFETSELDLYKDYDCETLTLRDIDPIRACYDVKLSQTCGIRDMAKISLYQNYLIYGNVAMIPYVTYAIDRASRGERA